MKPERNDPCPCGSGKKYKKCCGAAGHTIAESAAGADPFQLARQAFARGDFQAAQYTCRALLQRHPLDGDTNHLCGLVSYRLGNFAEAKARLAVAVRQVPGNVFVHSNLSLVLRDAGELEAAAASARRAIALDARLAEAHDNLATILKQQGDLAAAAEASRNAINLKPGNALFQSNLGETLLLQNDPQAAECCYRRALDLAPTLVAALSGLGTLCLQQERWIEARAWLEKALAAGAEDPMVFNNLGHALYRLRDAEGAVAAYKQALVRKPDFGGAHYNLGLVLESLGERTSALAAADAFSAALNHGYATWKSLDSLYRVAMRFGMVDRVYPNALKLSESAEFPHELLPSVIGVFGQACDFPARTRAWSRFRELYRAQRIDNKTISYLLLSSLYPADLGEDFIRELHRSSGAAMEAALAAQRFSDYRVSTHDRPLRIGYLSPDLYKHSVGFFVQHVIASHDRDAFQVYCYSLSKKSDEVTEFIRGHSTVFRDVEPLDDETLARCIHEDGIHLLIDLAGHTDGNRLEVLARRPAPLQLTWIGYLNSLGMKTVDYRITDRYADDPAAAIDTERLLMLPESFLCLGNFPECDIDPQPAALRNGHVTFASFNSLTKITSEAVRVWARVLAGVPGSRLLVASVDADSQAVRNNLHAEFARHGIPPERLALRGPLPRLDYLRGHNDVDIILDTWPFNGGTVTAGALWMGVPVVTLTGPAHRQRVGYSMLKNIGVGDTIAWSEDEYVKTAVSLAQDPARLAALRQTIAANLRRSVLCDAPRFTRQLEAALRRAWEEYATSQGPEPGSH
jgi:protein O-GlcNAc transferase